MLRLATISYTRPEQVEDFVSAPVWTLWQLQSVLLMVLTSLTAEPGALAPPLRFDILEECFKRLPEFPIVLHGSSSVPQDFVAKVNQYGGAMPDAIGIPEEMLREAAKSAVCKINIDSDIRLAITAAIREHFAVHPADFDPRQYLKPARQAVKDMVTHKLINVLGCNGKA